jgi:hypothetical protein
MPRTVVSGLIGGVPTRFILVDNTEEFRCAPRTVGLGDAVYVRPDGRVAKASAIVPDQVCVGVVLSFDNPKQCVVLVSGLARELFTNLEVGASYYLAPEAGKITTTPPSKTNHRIQLLGTAVSSTDLLLSVDHRRIINKSAGTGPKNMVWNDGVIELHEF